MWEGSDRVGSRRRLRISRYQVVCSLLPGGGLVRSAGVIVRGRGRWNIKQ